MPIDETTITKPPFNAINGEELRYKILKDLDTKLAEYDEFRQHLAYSKFMYLAEVNIAIDAYPVDHTIKMSALTQGQSTDYKPDPGAEPKRFNFKWGTKEPVTRPDKLRAETGLPIPKTTPTADGQMVDKLVEHKTPDIKPG